MESELFSWEGWDMQGALAFTYYRVKLKVAIGDFPIGKTFSTAFIDYTNGLLQFDDEEGVSYQFRLHFTVKEWNDVQDSNTEK